MVVNDDAGSLTPRFGLTLLVGTPRGAGSLPQGELCCQGTYRACPGSVAMLYFFQPGQAQCCSPFLDCAVDACCRIIGIINHVGFTV